MYEQEGRCGTGEALATAGDTMRGQTTSEFAKFQDQRVFSFPVIKLSLELYQKLLKIASFKGIPVEDFVESELRNIVLKKWNFAGNKPVGENQDEFI